MLSGFTVGEGEDRRVVAMMGFSRDLFHWNFPSSGSRTNIKLSELPDINPERAICYDENKWDMVAPDFMIDDDGSVYIVFSIGYFAYFHGDDTREGKSYYDEMYPYICKVDIDIPELTVYNSLTSKAESIEADPAFYPEIELKCTYHDAIPVKLPCMEKRYNVAHNHIDASLYKEDGYYYYIIKENGVTTEIFRTKDLSEASDPDNWEEICYDAVTGYEGPCLTKYDGQYLLFADRLATFKPTDLNGVQSKKAWGYEGTWVVKATTGNTGKLDGYTGWLTGIARRRLYHPGSLVPPGLL